MASRFRVPVLTTLGAAAVAGLLVWAMWPKPVPVDIAMVERGTLEVTVIDEGVARIRDIYVVSAPIAGKVLRSPLQVGDRVTANETVVAQVEPTAPAFLDIRARREAEAAVSAARAAVELAEAKQREATAQLDFARSEYERSAALSRRGIVSDRALAQARVSVSSAEAEIASAAATLEVRRRELESSEARLIGPGETQMVDEAPERCCIRLHPPVDGEVLKIHHESETVVIAGTPLLEIGDRKRIEIVVDLLSTDAVRVNEGANALIHGWGRPERLAARVRRVEPAGFTKVSALGVEEQRVRVILDLADPPERRVGLGHDYRVVANIIVEEHEDVLLLPLSALFRRGQQWACFVVGADGRAEPRDLEIGSRDLLHAAVLAGLEEGEQVVIHPSDRIEAGIRVTPRR